MAAADPDHRAAISSENATRRWQAITDPVKRTAATQRARDARLDLIKQRVDPDGRLAPGELDRAVSAYIQVEMRRLARLAAAARAEKRRQQELTDLAAAERDLADVTGVA